MSELGIKIDKAALESYLSTKLNELPEKARELLGDESSGIAEKYRAAMIDEAPYVTGDLREGHIVEETGEYERLITSDVPHFPFVVLGTRAHVIRGNPWLYWEGAEHPVRRVNHPGTAPNDYVSRAFENAEGAVDAEIQRFLDSFIGE